MPHIENVDKNGKNVIEEKPPLNENKDEPLIHQLEVEQKSTSDMSLRSMFILFLLVIVAGITSGFAVNYFTKSGVTIGGGADSSKKATAEASTEKCKDIMTADEKKTFKDDAEGTLKDGGHESGEGSFHLERNKKDDSQTAYLTSDSVDLSPYVGKKVRIYGETFASQNVGWLINVGCVELL